MNYKILIVDDDTELIEMLTLRFSCKGFDVLSAANGPDGLRSAYENHPDLVVLDIMMPGMDGLEVCQRLRELSDVPIVLLTGKSGREDVVHGFQAGADDYVKKPFHVWELEERIQAILKRSRGRTMERVEYDDGVLRIDLERQNVLLRGGKVHLTPTEFRLLSCLAQQPGCVVNHDELLTQVWGTGYRDANENLTVYVHYLRDKLKDDQEDHQYIRTRWGVGYWFAPRQESPKAVRNVK